MRLILLFVFAVLFYGQCPDTQALIDANAKATATAEDGRLKAATLNDVARYDWQILNLWDDARMLQRACQLESYNIRMAPALENIKRTTLYVDRYIAAHRKRWWQIWKRR
jgi:hypothetical protein